MYPLGAGGITVIKGTTDTLKKYILNLGREFESMGISGFSSLCDDLKLAYLYAYYHYFNGDSSSISDIMAGNVYSSDASDRIAGIYVDQDSDGRDVDAVIALHLDEDSDFDESKIVDMLMAAERAVYKAKERKPEIRKSLIKIFKTDGFIMERGRILKIKFITNWEPSTAKKKKILQMISDASPKNRLVFYGIEFGADIEFEILDMEEPRESVEEAVLELDHSGNALTFGKERSLIVNVSAKSLKNTYLEYGYRGLFAQNLRYYVKNLKIDGKIIESIQQYPDNFWYFNNGIIITCDSYELMGNRILIKDFSIINGGQTTKLIGETEFQTDFYVQCKIIRNKYEEMSDRLRFVADVAEASNTQKPIRDKDLIANRAEQRELKLQLAEAGIYCQIKRGEKISKKLYPAPWQNTTNEEIGQFIFSFVYQKPGQARNNKSSICGDINKYTKIFGQKYSVDLLSDLLKIKTFYKLWLQEVKKQANHDEDSYIKVGIVSNGMLFMTAIIGITAKFYYHKSRVELVDKLVSSDRQLPCMSVNDIQHHIFKVNMLDRNRFFALFELLYDSVLRPSYVSALHSNGTVTYSNFTKQDGNYIKRVFPQTWLSYKHCLSTDPVISDVFYEAGPDELAADEEMFSRMYSDLKDMNIKINSTQKNKLRTKLNNFRKVTATNNGIKESQVFSAEARDIIVNGIPRSVDALESLRCLGIVEIEMYGNDIVGIINEFLLTEML